MDIASRLTFRLTREDVAHVASVGARLQANGRAFVSRTQAIREALRVAAEAPTGAPLGTPQGDHHC